MAEIDLDRVTKVYPNGFLAVDELTLSLADGEFLVLVGPSGCGKSTVLRMIAGLESITRGELRIGGEVTNLYAPRDRDIAMVFQDYALYPHMTAAENMAFPLKLAGVPKAERSRLVAGAAGVLELTEYLDSKPAHLSGGQRQRVAMGRALVRQPSAFLMDEPLSNLDAKLRVQMRAEIASVQRQLDVTTFYVTHDQVEAMTMGDRVAVIKDGVLQQVDSPETLYLLPRNVFVAAFIGSPSMNLFEARLTGDADDPVIEYGNQRLQLPPGVLGGKPALRAYLGQRVIVGVRPEDLEDATLDPSHPSAMRFASSVEAREALGAETLIHFDIDAVPVDSGDPDLLEDLATVGGTGTRCIARCSPRSRARAGEPIEINVMADRLHFFDPSTTESITG